MNHRSKFLSLLLALAMLLSLAVTASADELTATSAAPQDGSITVLYTNDVHTYIDGDLTYSMIASLKDTYEYALLVDAGDHIQGTA